MSAHVLSPDALQDLQDIWDFVALERDVRFWPTGSYLIVYRERHDALQVLAVLHGSRDVPEVMRKREYPPS